jgi:hypothetical protein
VGRESRSSPPRLLGWFNFTPPFMPHQEINALGGDHT